MRKKDRMTILDAGDMVFLHDGGRIEANGGELYFDKGALIFEKDGVGYDVPFVLCVVGLPCR